MEELFGQAATRAGSIDNLLDEFFGFLHRRTDFYVEIKDEVPREKKYSMGFPKGRAQQMVLQAFNKYKFKDYNDVVGPEATQGPQASSVASVKPLSHDPSKELAPLEETGSDLRPIPVHSEPILRYTSSGKQIPIGNGGVGPGYFWTQSLRETTITLEVPIASRSKDIACQISARSLKISIAGKELLKGDFEDPIQVSESLWTMSTDSSRKHLIVTLEKTRETWWASALVGHPEIDTNMVDSTKKLSEFDTETQAALTKILWEQRHPPQQDSDISSTNLLSKYPLPDIPSEVHRSDELK